MRILNDADVRTVFDLDTAIASQRAAFLALGRGEAWQPGKILGGPDGTPDTVFCYAARMDEASGVVCKFGGINPGNGERGLPTIHAVVTVLDPETGEPLTLMDGRTLTTLRTAAGSAVAVEALAVKGAERLLVLGSGVQGRAHVRALCRGGRLTRVAMWSPDPANLAAGVAELCAEGYDVEAVASASAGLATADVVVCATLATRPLLGAPELRAGTTLVVVGSFEPHRLEIGPDVIAAGRVVVDHEPTARSNCGPLIAAGERGAGERGAGEPAVVELGHVLTGAAAGRETDDDLVTFLSAGLGVQDAAAAWSIHRTAVQQDIGSTLNWATNWTTT